MVIIREMGNFIKKHLSVSLFPSKQVGFTLIELITVFSIMAVLTAVGIQSFSSFNESQTLTISATDVATMLRTAKSRAISQAIPSQCASGTFKGYEVDISLSQKTYTLLVVCNSRIQVDQGTLPSKLKFVNGSTTTVLFTLGTGTVNNTATISINGYGITKNITVSTAGNTTVQ